MRNFLTKKLNKRWIGFFIIFTIFVVTIWSSNKVVQELKREEHKRIENYAKSLELVSSSELIDPKTQDFLFKLIEDNKTIPVALVDEKGNIVDTKNIDENILKNTRHLQQYVKEMKRADQTIEIELIDGKNYVHFKNSNLLNQLQYYPVIIILLILTFFGFAYWYFKTIRDTEKSYLWAGMAKETAHQIGTPLSSLMGWVELLKLEDIDQMSVIEIEKDVDRLNRFKKENIEFIRAFSAGLKSIEIDASGRLLLPKDLMVFAGITKDVVMSVTSNNIIEIWDKKKYEDAVNIPNEDFENLAERVMGSLGNKEEGSDVS